MTDILPDSIVSRTGFGTGAVTDVDEGRTANTADIISTGTGGADQDNITFSFGNLSTVASATQLVIGVNASTVVASDADSIQIQLKVNGTAVATTTPTLTSTYTWYTVTATGTWSQTDINSITATITRNALGSGNAASRDDNVRIASLYTEVTHTLPSAVFTQNTFRWYANQDNVQPGSALSVEGDDIDSLATTPLRLRLGLSVSANNLSAASQSFKLQYSTSATGPWTDVASSGSGAVTWKYKNNATPADGTTITSALLSGSPTLQSYTESNPTVTNPNAIDAGQNGEWDFALDGSGATAGTRYHFRMTLADGTALSSYTAYPQVVISPPTLTQSSYRWFTNADSAQPGAALASENTAASAEAATPVRLRSRIAVDGTNLPQSGQNFELQYAERTGATCSASGNGYADMDAAGSPEARYATGGANMTGGAWQSPQNVNADDGIEAEANFIGGGSEESGYLLTEKHGFALPPTATINGIELIADRRYAGTEVVGEYGIFLAKEGALVGSNKARAVSFTNAAGNWGGATDLWGTTWTASDINSLGFGAAISVNGMFLNAASAHIDHVQIKVYYTLTTPPPLTYYNNPSAVDGTTISSTVNDPSGGGRTAVLQSYRESNPFTNNTAAIPAGSDGLWDFSITTSTSANGRSYCLRIVKEDRSVLGSYSQLPVLAVGGEPPDSPTLLRQVDDSDVPAGEWIRYEEFFIYATVSDPDTSSTLYLCIEVDAIGTAFSGQEDFCGSAVNYSGSPIEAGIFMSNLIENQPYHWQARVKDNAGLYSSWVSFGNNLESATDFTLDYTNPNFFTVYDGNSTGTDMSVNDGSLSSLNANWTSSGDAGSGLSNYEYGIGTAPGLVDVKTWTDVGLDTFSAATGLNLKTSQKYYFTVKAYDFAGNTQQVGSNGILIAPSVNFSVSPSSITLDALHAGNSYTSTKATTLTTSTNAYGGYVVRSFISDLLRSSANDTIASFNGGSYASPDNWQSGDIGFGYTSSDNLVQGVDKFQPATCPGGSERAAPGCYAPFASSGPGDIVADHTTNVTGTPISNQQFTVTYRATTPDTQNSAQYNTNIIYTITPVY